MSDLRITAQRAVEHFGEKPQVLKAIEEMSELSTELARFLQDSAMMINVLDEIADVIIMMTQLHLIFGEDLVNQKIQEKLRRLENRIEDPDKKSGAI